MDVVSEQNEPERAAHMKAWAELEPRIIRLGNGAAAADFYRRLHGEYRVATRYAENLPSGARRRYGRQLQMEGLRTMDFDGVAGAAEYVVGAWIESFAAGGSEVGERARALIDRAIARLGNGGRGQALA